MELHYYAKYNNKGGVMNENRNLHCVRRRILTIEAKTRLVYIYEENVMVCRLLLLYMVHPHTVHNVQRRGRDVDFL